MSRLGPTHAGAVIVLLSWRLVSGAAPCGQPSLSSVPASARNQRLKDWLYCLQAAETCSDDTRSCLASSLPAACSQTVTRKALSSWSLAGIVLQVSHFCPKSCGACEGQKAGVAVSACEEGWTYADGSCFRHFMSPYATPLTFADAEAECQQQGAHLAEVDSPTKSRVVAELIRQRPKWTRKHLLSSSTWIGLRTKGRCSLSNADWLWVASGRELVYDNWMKEDSRNGLTWSTPLCNKDGATCVLVNYPSENEGWYDVSCTSRWTISWACSKPALVRPAGANASCSDLGMNPISDLGMCEAAAAAIGVDARTAFRNNLTPRPEGCYYGMDRTLYLSVHPDNRGRGSTLARSPRPFTADWWQMQICYGVAHLPAPRPTSALRPTSPPRKVPPSANQTYRAAVAAMDAAPPVPEGHEEEVLAAALMASFGVMLLMLRRRRPIVDGVAAVVLLARSRLRTVGRAKDESEELIQQVRRGLARRRQHLAIIGAGVLLTYRLLHIIVDAVAADAPCQGSRSIRMGIMGAELLEVYLACALLATNEGRCRRLLAWAWVVLIPAARLAVTGLAAEQVLLSTTRIYEDVLWRLLVGAALRPSLALALNTVYAGGVVLLNALLIPDGMIPLTDGGGCISLHTADVVDTAKTPRFRGMLMEEARVMNQFVDTLMRESTSYLSFAVTELLSLALVVACLSLFWYLNAMELRSSLKQKSTDSLVHAVTEMLRKLCDATVQLDASLRITKPSPSFAALLHSDTAPIVIADFNFHEHLSGPDEEVRVRAALQDEADSRGLGETLSVSFKDAMGVTVPCQIFHASFRSFDEQPRYVLGINEVGAREVLPIAELGAHVGDALRQQRKIEAVEMLEGSNNYDAAPSNPSSASSISSADVERHFDFTVHDLRIIKVNAGTEHFFAQNPVGIALDELLETNDDWLTFTEWQDDIIATLRKGILPEPPIQSLTPLDWILRPFSGHVKALSKDRRYRVQLEVTFPPLPEPMDVTKYVVSARITSAERIRVQEPAKSHRRHKHKKERKEPKPQGSGTMPSLQAAVLGAPLSKGASSESL